MTRRTATEVLRDHARERWLRGSTRAADMEAKLGGQLGVERRMGETAWVESCLLTRGVDAELLDVLGVQECEGGAEQDVPNRERAEHMGVVYERPTEKWAARLTLVQAAQRLGLGHLDFKALKAMRLAAIRVVTENQLARHRREKGSSIMKSAIIVMAVCAMFSGCAMEGVDDVEVVGASSAPTKGPLSPPINALWAVTTETSCTNQYVWLPTRMQFSNSQTVFFLFDSGYSDETLWASLDEGAVATEARPYAGVVMQPATWSKGANGELLANLSFVLQSDGSELCTAAATAVLEEP